MSKRSESNFAVVCVEEFAKEKRLTLTEAFRYLYNFKGLKFLKDCYDIEHTLSFPNVVEDLTAVCRHQGGLII